MGRLDAGLAAHLNTTAPAPVQTGSGRQSTGIGSFLGGTIGAIGGGLLGGGATFGLGAAPGAIAGGGAGSALGDALEQLLTHSDHHVDLGNVGQEGAMGLAGGVAGKAIGAGVKGLRAAQGLNIGLKGIQTADQLAPKAGNLASALDQIPGKMTAAGKADTAANKLLASQYGTISKPVARSVDLNGTVGTLSKYGITKPADAERIAGAFTGSDGLVSKAVRSAAGSADRVSTDGIRKIAQDALVNNQVVGAKAKGFNQFLTATMNKLAGGGSGTLKPGAHPSDTLDVIKSLESRAADLTGKGGTYHLPTSEDKALAKVHTEVANELKDRLYGGANVSKVLTPEFRSSLVDLHPGNAKWANFVDNTVMKVKDPGQLRSTMAPFVKISKAIGEADTNSGTFGGKVGNAAGSRGLLGQAAAATLGSNVAKRTAAGAIKGANSAVQTAGTIAGAAIPQGAARALLNPQTPQPPTTALPEQTPADALSIDPTAATGAQDTPQSSSAFTPETLQALAIHDIQTTGGKNLDKIATLEKVFGSSPTTNKPLSDAANKGVGNAASGLAALDQLSAELKKNPGVLNKNAVAGILPGSLGNAARNASGTAGYEAARKEAMDILARLRTGAAMSKNEESFYSNLLPAPGDSPTVAAQKIARYRAEFQGYLNRAQGGSPDLTSLTQQ